MYHKKRLSENKKAYKKKDVIHFELHLSFYRLHRFSFGDFGHFGFVEAGVTVDAAVGEIAVHAVDFGQVFGTAYGADIHFKLLVPAVITVSERQVHAFIESHIHCSSD